MYPFSFSSLCSYLLTESEETRVFQQYRTLTSGNARPQETLLQSTTSGPLSTFPDSLPLCYHFLTLVSFTALLSEVLIIVLAGIPYSPTQLYLVFLVSTYTSIAILGFMLLTLVAVVFSWRMGNPDITQILDILGIIWIYLLSCSRREIRESQDGENIIYLEKPR